MKKIILLFLLLPLFTFSQDKVKFKAIGLTCSMCSNAIHKSLSKEKSIIKIEPNLQTQEWSLEYKSGEFNAELLRKKVKDSGFDLSYIWLNGQLVYTNIKKPKVLKNKK